MQMVRSKRKQRKLCVVKSVPWSRSGDVEDEGGVEDAAGGRRGERTARGSIARLTWARSDRRSHREGPSGTRTKQSSDLVCYLLAHCARWTRVYLYSLQSEHTSHPKFVSRPTVPHPPPAIQASRRRRTPRSELSAMAADLNVIRPSWRGYGGLRYLVIL